MKKILLFIALLISVGSSAQNTQGDPGKTHIEWLGEYAYRNSLKLPKVCGTPTDPTGLKYGPRGLVVFDTCNNKLYVRGTSTWTDMTPVALTTTGTSGVATLTGNTLNIPDYTYTLPSATPSTLGGVKPDGTTITVSAGVISATSGGSTVSTSSFKNELTSPFNYSEALQGFNGAMVRKRSTTFLPNEWHDGVKAIVTADTILVFCGWNGGHSPFNTDSVFYSTDGLTATYLGKAPWGKMHAFEVIKADDGYWYQAGADQYGDDSQRRSVWRSKSPQLLSSWVRMTKTAPFSAFMYEFTAKGDSLYMLGGQLNETGSVSDSIWVGWNGGANWKFRSKAPAGIIGKNITGCGEWFNDRFYIVSGGIYNTDNVSKTFERNVYSTIDFQNWRTENSTPTGTGVQYPIVIPWDGKLWRMGGNDSIANTNYIIYMSKDGNWHRFKSYDTANVNYAATHAPATVVWRDKILQVAGNSQNDVWEIKRVNAINNPEGDIKFGNGLTADSIVTGFSSIQLDITSKSSSSTPLMGLATFSGAGYGAITMHRQFIIEQGSSPTQKGPVIQGSAGFGTLTCNYSGTSGYYHYFESPGYGIYANDNTPLILLKPNGQAAIGAGTVTAGAALDVPSTTRAFYPPRMTKAQRNAISSVSAGATIYQTDNTPGLRVYNGTNWMKFTEAAD